MPRRWWVVVAEGRRGKLFVQVFDSEREAVEYFNLMEGLGFKVISWEL